MIELFVTYVLVTALVLSLVVFIHEYGHYRAGRFFGMALDAFSIGFGKELWGRTDKRGMRWKICRFPFGGFVVFRGEVAPFTITEDVRIEALQKREFWAFPVWQRAIVAFSGPLFNVVFAIALLSLFFFAEGKPIANPVVSAVEVGSGADLAGVQIGDRIYRLNGQDVPDDFLIFVKMVNASSSNQLNLDVLRGDRVLSLRPDLYVMKDETDFGGDASRRVMGVILGNGAWELKAIGQVDDVPTHYDPDIARALLKARLGSDVVVLFGLKKKESDDEPKFYKVHPEVLANEGLSDDAHPFHGALIVGAMSPPPTKPLSLLASVGESFVFSGKVISKVSGVIYQMFTGKKNTSDLGGVIRIGEMTGEAVRQASVVGYAGVFRLIAALSVCIGFLNLFPLPMLDGGHLLYHGYEAVTGSPPSSRMKAYFMVASMGFLMSIVIVANILDVFEIFF